MNDHTANMLEFAAIVTPIMLACFGGIVAVYSRLTRIETMVTPMWQSFIKGSSDNG